MFRRNLQGTFVSAPLAHQVHPQAEQQSILGHFCWRGRFGGLFSIVLDRLLGATTKKVVDFKKVHPDKILGYAYATKTAKK